MSRLVSFEEYIQEVLKTAKYHKGKDFDCVVAVVRALPGCITQGKDYEDAMANFIEAIGTWVLSAIRNREKLPEYA